MQKGGFHVEGVLRAGVNHHRRNHVDHQRYPGDPDYGPPLNGLRVCETVDRLDEQIETDDKQSRQIDERRHDFRTSIAEGHKLVGWPAPDPPRKQSQSKRCRVAEIVQRIGDQCERTRQYPPDDLGDSQQDVEGDGQYKAAVAHAFFAVTVPGMTARLCHYLPPFSVLLVVVTDCAGECWNVLFETSSSRDSSPSAEIARPSSANPPTNARSVI